MSLSVFYYCICAFLCCCRKFNLSLCRLSPFLLFYVAVSTSCLSSEFYCKETSWNCMYFCMYFTVRRPHGIVCT